MIKILLTAAIGLAALIAQAQCFVKIESGEQHSIALADDGTLWGWGSNTAGECGITPSNHLNVPTQIGSDNDWMDISCGAYHTLALKTDSTLYGWGFNSSYQLGTGDAVARYTPTLLFPGQKVKSIDGGPYHSLIVTADGYLFGTGLGDSGQFGDNANSTYSLWTNIASGNDWAFACGAMYTSYAVKENGSLYVTGQNANGEFATATPSSSTSWISVSPGVNFIKIDAGFNFAYGLTVSGVLFSWGINADGQLANNSTVSQSSVYAVSADVVDFDCAPHAAIWMTSTDVYTAGKNDYQQSQTGTINDVLTANHWNTSYPVLNNPVGVSMGIFSSSVLTDDGLVSWGRNDRGICGNGTFDNLTEPALTYSCTPASIEEGHSALNLHVYPIPARNEIKLIVEENTIISIFSISGTQIATYEVKPGINSINIESLDSGVYFIQGEDVKQTRFIKQ